MMNLCLRLAVTVCAVVVFVGPTRPASGQSLTDAQVTEAIDNIKAFLFESQDPSGGWFGSYHRGHADGRAVHHWGPSAMAALALVVSGESPQREEIDRAIQLLAEAEIGGVYPLSMRIHLWSYLPERFERLLGRDGRTMLRSAYGGARYGYGVHGHPRFDPNAARIDHSTTQYGILALWQYAKRGGRVPSSFWHAAADHFLETQRSDGGWSYRGRANTTQSMTCAGLTVLLIAQQALYRDRDQPHPQIQAAIQGGMAYLDRNWSLEGMKGYGGASYVYYGYERVGLVSGRRRFGGHDWFETIAGEIVEKRARYGDSIHSAAFDLMFLARGRVPLWISKLEVPDADWDNRPNDVYFLNRYLSEFVETEVNWQVVSIDSDPEGWANAPLLWLSMSTEIDFSDEQVDALKRYLDMGGTLLINPESRSAGHAAIELGRRMYPHLAFQDMPADHPVAGLVVGNPRTPRNPQARGAPRIKVLGNGARDLIILPQEDWGMGFQADRDPDPVADRHWRYITNLYAVVTDRGHLTPRLSSPRVERSSRASVGTIKVVVPVLGGRPLPEADAYLDMKNVMQSRTGYELVVEQLPLTGIAVADPSLVHLMGVDAIELSAEEREAIAAYLGRGGTVLVETVGGRGDFARSVARQLAELVPGQDELIRNHSNPILTGRGLPEGAARNRRVIYRPLTIERADPGTGMLIRGYLQNGRYPVLVSHEDLSLGMLGVRQYGINGYAQDSARKIMINVLLDAVQAYPGSDTPTR